MNELQYMVMASGAGLLIGSFFYGGLWWTVKKGMKSGYPALWFIGSLITRFAVTLLGFYLVSGNHWERMLMCLAGFVIARAVVTRLTRVTEVKQIQYETQHENQSR